MLANGKLLFKLKSYNNVHFIENLSAGFILLAVLAE